ncbi:MAG TPA: protein kinase [Polyangiaceae bacterium]|nr:protein kinase [Polyangiaceae bacterium]
MASSAENLSAVAPGDRPTRFGLYEVVREIGRGGMGCVYEARHPQLGGRVAIKVLHSALTAHPLAGARFLREAKAAAQIKHQHVVQVFDTGTLDGLPFIVMEFLEGRDLAALLADKGPVPLAGIIEIFLPVISAVHTAHRAGIVHRDLKPANLMITRREPWGTHPMVLDFGISKTIHDDVEVSSLTRSESMLGTVPYMAPELTKGAKLANEASDQYAIGVMLYECATGRRPFLGATQYELMHAIVTGAVTPPSSISSAVPPELDAVILRAMNRDPAERFGSLRDLGAALLSLADDGRFALWKGVFVDAGDEERDPWFCASKTFADGASFARAATASASALSRVQRWGVPIALCAIVAAALMARVSRRSQAVSGDIGPGNGLGGPTIAAASASVRAATEPLARREESTVEPPAMSAAPHPSSAPAATVVLDGRGPRRKNVETVASASRSADGRALAPPADGRAPSPPSVSAQPKPARGTNGALIFD